MAEGLIRARLAADGVDGRVTVASVGTWAATGQPATENAVLAMAERGIDIRDHRSREVTATDMADSDLVLVMTEGHQSALTVEFPGQRDRVRRMSELAGGQWDVADPVGQPLAAYRATASELARLIDAGWRVILGEAP
jgi:protein-tyrosine-phosphatase